MSEKHELQSPAAHAAPSTPRSSTAAQRREAAQAARAAAAVGTKARAQTGVVSPGPSWNRRSSVR